jgi:hypothetical protein
MNAINPAGSQFNATVNGKPTGLAGCTQAGSCERAVICLRANPALPYKAVMMLPRTGACRAFILDHSSMLGL